MVVVGGVIPKDDYDAIAEAGAVAIFPPGTSVVEAAERVLEKLNERLGYQQRSAAE